MGLVNISSKSDLDNLPKGGSKKKGSRRIGFIAFVAFFGFIGLMKWIRVEGFIPTALGNTINPKNAMNKATQFSRVRGWLTAIGGRQHTGSKHPSIIAGFEGPR